MTATGLQILLVPSASADPDIKRGNALVAVSGLQRHRAAVQSTVQQQRIAAVVDPELGPAILCGVVDVVALAIAAATALPVFGDHAVAEDLLDAAVPDPLTLGAVDVPFADPEVEVAEVAAAAGLAGFRRVFAFRLEVIDMHSKSRIRMATSLELWPSSRHSPVRAGAGGHVYVVVRTEIARSR